MNDEVTRRLYDELDFVFSNSAALVGGCFFCLRVSCGRVFFFFFFTSLLWFKGASCGCVFCCCGLRASCRGVVFLFFGCGLRASMMHK